MRILLWFLLPQMMTSCYIFRQAIPFLTHRINARPIEKLMEDESTHPELINFLHEVEDIRAFAGDELGLEDTENYTRFYSIDRNYLAAIVHAAEEFSIEPHLFKYPLVGPLPYRGHYSPEHALKDKKRLETKGLEVIVRPVDAFSSLGYFRDPLYSFMVDYSASRLAELIIHEQTHATLFIKGESGFNEKLATVVGREGSLQYVISRYGKDSEEYKAVIASRSDSERFTDDMRTLGRRLVAVYSLNVSTEEKRRRKAVTIELFKREFGERYEERYIGEAYRAAAEMELNNAYLSIFDLYEEHDGRLQLLLERTGGIARMVEVLKGELEVDGVSPWDVVAGLLRSPSKQE